MQHLLLILFVLFILFFIFSNIFAFCLNVTTCHIILNYFENCNTLRKLVNNRIKHAALNLKNKTHAKLQI